MSAVPIRQLHFRSGVCISIAVCVGDPKRPSYGGLALWPESCYPHPPMDRWALTHLRTLEAESIHIIREVVAEFARPVMLYSIGKDSSVMVRLAQKAFYPAPFPFPLLHIDTTYKFDEMIAFRDSFTR